MFDNVIVGIEGEESGQDAIALAQRLRSSDSRLILAHAYIGELYPWRGSSAAYDVAARDEAREMLERMRDDAAPDAEVRALGAPSPGRGLHDLAEAEGADLLVVGSSRRGLIDRVLVGDRTRAALNGAPCAVAIAPAGLSRHEGGIDTIGVGYNGSEESEHAVAFARDLASDLGAHVRGLQVVSIPERYFVGPAFPNRPSVEELLREAREHIERVEGIDGRAVYGDPAEELATFSAELDLLIVGSRSYGPTRRLVHGSTAMHLARTARCPLLVLTRAGRERESGEDVQRDRDGERPGAGVS